MDGDPRISKPRLPKPYTDEQLVFLRSHVGGFETRTRSHVRGDAKKFALDRASEFLVRFGLPPDLQGADKAEPRFREQIYNWYKNTVGRARRKLEGRTRSKKPSDKGGISWSPTLATYASPEDMSDPGHSHQQSPQQQPQPSPSHQQLQFAFQSTVPVPAQVASPTPITLNVTSSALRDALIAHAIDLPTLSSLIQSYVLANPSATPLLPIIHALFDAASSLLAPPASTTSTSNSAATSALATGSASVLNVGDGQARSDILRTLLRRFIDACAFFPNTLVHADVAGPLAGPRALQTALRKSSVWAPISGSGSQSGSATAAAVHGSLSDEMERTKADRQRRKDHVQWAQIHAAAIELGIVGGASAGASPSPSSSPNAPVTVIPIGVVGTNGNAGYHHHHPRQSQEQELGYTDVSAGVAPLPSIADASFSEMMARDAVWESDEVEWVAGIIILQAIIRTQGIGRKAELEQLLGAYERRWKEIKDEARQALMADVLLGARGDLTHLEDTVT